MTQKHTFAYFLVILSSFLYGTNPTMSKLMAAEGGNTDAFLLARFGLAVVMLWGICLLFKQPIRLPFMKALKVIALGTLIYGVSFFYITAVQFIPAGLATVLLFTYPLWTAFFEALFYKKRPGKSKILLMIVAFMGLVLTSIHSFTGDLSLEGFFFALIAALGLALNALWGYRATQSLSSYTVSFWMMFGCLVISLCVLFLRAPLFPETLLGIGLNFGAAAFFCLGLLCFFIALPKLGASEAGFFNNLEPLISLGLAYTFLNETLSFFELSGAALILFAVTAMSIIGMKKKHLAMNAVEG